MVNYSDPGVVLGDLAALHTLYLITNGIYLWEFFTNLDYEFGIIRGRRPYRWTIWLYSFARLATLAMVVLNLVYLNPKSPINCQVWITFQVLTGYFGLVASSLLIVIRIMAIWNKDKIVMSIAFVVWFTNAAASTEGVARLRSYWEPILKQCVVTNSDTSKLNIIVLLITDVVLLSIVLVGLIRLRSDGDGTFGIGLLLLKQGVLWLFLATIAEVPPAVFIILDLNAPFNLMFQLPSVVTMTISATRMYRSLSDFVSGTTDIASDNLPKDGTKASKMQWGVAVPSNQVGTSLSTSSEPYQIPRSGNHDTYSSAEEQACEKSHGYESQQGPGEAV